MKIALHQMTSGIAPASNVAKMIDYIGQASSEGAQIYFAPEMSIMLDRNRERARAHIEPQVGNPWIEMLSEAARHYRIWVHLGSIPVVSECDPERLANRSLLIDADGRLTASYDKMHLFDVDLSSGESWRESAAYIRGLEPVVANSPLGLLGLSICYDLRFSDLYSYLARSGASAIAVPAAFTVPTGLAHWHVLLRARAIESAAFVIAAAQCGKHEDGRETFGHSLVVDPWGDVLLDMGTEEGLGFVDIDLRRIDEVRQQIPVHLNRRTIPPRE